jgi:hypothetical protein
MPQLNNRRRLREPSGYDASSHEVKKIKSFNKNLRYVEGFTRVLNAGDNQYDIKLKSPGKRLLGISIIPIDNNTTNVANCTVTVKVNNNNVLTDAAVPNLVPNYVQGMIFFPLPQELTGNDTITAVITQNTSPAPSESAVINVFYVPR